MATNLPSCFSIQFSEQLLKFLGNFTLLKYVKSQRSYGFLITKELIFGFQILDLKDHFSVSLIWADEKNVVARENSEMSLQSVETLLRKRREEIIAEICKNCAEHVKQVEYF